MKKLLLPILFLSLPFLLLLAQSKPTELKVGSMTLKYEVQEDSLWMHLSAPTTGWIAIGFNDRNAIVGADLLMFRVKEGLTLYEDQFVTGLQQHPADWELGSGSSIQLLEGKETLGTTSATFKIPLQSGDKHDFQHRLGKSFWLIMAYSRADDFEHHSIMRKHQKYTWKFDHQKP